MKANEDIRTMARNNGIPYWQIALKLGCCEQSIVNWMRTPLPDAKRERFIKAIAEIKEERRKFE